MSTAPPHDERVVLITGASSGIGRATASAYARRGARLVLLARRPDRLDEVASECTRLGAADVLVAAADVTDRDRLHSAVDRGRERFGGFDVVVHVAAVSAFGRVEDIDPDVFDAAVTTNVLGTVNVVRSVLPMLRERSQPHLVLIGSVLGQAATPWQAPYVMSKFAQDALVRILREENRASAVRIHTARPGPVNTDLYTDAAHYTDRRPQAPRPALAPDTVARAVLAATGRTRHSSASVGPGNALLVGLYRWWPSLYDATIGPLLRAAGMFGEPAPHSAGTVLLSRDTPRQWPEPERLGLLCTVRGVVRRFGALRVGVPATGECADLLGEVLRGHRWFLGPPGGGTDQERRTSGRLVADLLGHEVGELRDGVEPLSALDRPV